MEPVTPKLWRGVRNALIPSLLLWGLIIWSISAAFAQSGGSTTRPTWFDSVGVQHYISTGNPLPVTASVSASISGFPTVQSTGTPIAVTTGGVTGTLPAGAVVVATNAGATNNAFCKLGASATTSDQLIAPNSWFAFTVGANTQLTCITSTSTTTVNMVGGSGLPTGAGGGGGGSGGGGAVTVADAADVTQGALADAAAAAGGTGSVSAKLRLATTQLNTINSTLGSPFQAGGSLAANQSVNEAQINGVTPLMGNGVSGTGSQRVNIASDNTAFAVNAAATLNAETTKVIGTVRNVGNAGGVVDFAGQNAASPANAWLVGAQFNTTPTTLTTGNTSPLQIDNAGNLLVNIKAGSSSGTVAQGSTTSGQSGNLVQCAVTTAAPTYTTAQTDPLSCDTAGNIRVTVTNANANGQAAMAASSPVVIASNQSAIPVVGPTAVGSANANPPVVIGGTATGAAGQNVQGLSIVAASVAPVTATNTAVVVDLRPDSPGIIALGQTTKSASVPVTIASDQLGGATTANSLPVALSSLLPANATALAVQITASATGTTAATTATLAGVASKTTYLCGFSIRANATAAATGNATVTGTITGTLNFTQWTAPLASGIGITEPPIGTPCIPASAVNTGIAVVSAAPGAGGVVSVTAWGFQL